MSDLIDREQAIGALNKAKTVRSESGELFVAKINAQMNIDALPSAEPTFDARDTQYNLPIGTDCISRQAAIEPKRGEWLECDVFDEHNITEWQSAKCSVCGHYHTTPYLYNFTRYSFCPHCGAKMER